MATEQITIVRDGKRTYKNVTAERIGADFIVSESNLPGPCLPRRQPQVMTVNGLWPREVVHDIGARTITFRDCSTMGRDPTAAQLAEMQRITAGEAPPPGTVYRGP